MRSPMTYNFGNWTVDQIQKSEKAKFEASKLPWSIASLYRLILAFEGAALLAMMHPCQPRLGQMWFAGWHRAWIVELKRYANSSISRCPSAGLTQTVVDKYYDVSTIQLQELCSDISVYYDSLGHSGDRYLAFWQSVLANKNRTSF
jgi:hypothetical protein